ncbi:MAG TPA: DUF4173 domain-containing protein [Anaerovoracaceae bacterium]|nr:DUF4173 domain-containing protein [Anaerovoracaceae bacterium]
MNGDLSGGMNGTIYERLNAAKPAPMSFSTADIVFAYSMLVCGFLYWNFIDVGSLGLGVTLFTAVLCTSAIFYFRAAGIRQSKTSLLFLGIVILSAANFALFDGGPVKAFNFIFLSLGFVYWVCLTTGTRLENKISIYILSDMLRQLLVIPFGNFAGCFKGIGQVFLKNKKGKGVLGGIVGFLIFLPVLILVITLLTSADAAFESLVDRVRFIFSANLLEYILDFILGLPVACYLYGLIYGSRYKRNIGNVTTETVDEYVTVLRFAPGATVYSALTALNLIYLVFFLAQTSYLFSAFNDSLPQTLTYAEYARRGFFELCAVSGINFAVIAAAHLITKRDNIKILRGETAALCIFTVALIVTAMSKMGMYIGYYGLTRLRVYTSWFMIVLLFLFIIILFRQFKGFNGTRIAAAGCICLFMALCYGNVDGVIAKYNIDRYQAGTLESLDLDALTALSDAAVPYLYELYQETDDSEIKNDLRVAIKEGVFQREDMFGDVYKDDFRDINLQSYRANLIRETI